MQMKESKSPKALVSKVTGLEMTEGDKITQQASIEEASTLPWEG